MNSHETTALRGFFRVKTIEFCGYRLDLVARRLHAPDGRPLGIGARAFDVLEALVVDRDRLVGREELLQRCWPGRVVEENNLNQAIAVLRRTFGTKGDDHAFIVTVPGRGYRFVAPVSEVIPAAGPINRAKDPDVPRQAGWRLAALAVLVSLLAGAARTEPSAIPVRHALAGLPSPCEGADPAAYRAYKRGSYLRTRPGMATLTRAVAAYDEAIRRDPRCARAWAGKAFAYRAMAIAADMDPALAFPEAQAAVDQALRLDPRSAEAYATRGIIEFFHDWDWTASEASLRRAIELEPRQAEAHYALAHLLHNIGRPEEALRHARRAAELDPLSPAINTIVASFLLGQGEEQEAELMLDSVLEVAPGFWLALFWRANLETQRGDLMAALRDMGAAVEACRRCSHAVAGLAWLQARAGRRAEALTLLEEMELRDASGYFPATRLSLAYDALGQRSRALDMLERAYAERDVYLTFLRVDPRLAAMRDEPRYRALAARMRL